jgi:hypothetical protein
MMEVITTCETSANYVAMWWNISKDRTLHTLGIEKLESDLIILLVAKI